MFVTMRRAIKDRLYHWAVVVIRWGIMWLPRKTALQVGEALGIAAFWIARAERYRAYANLHSSFKDKTPRELRKILQDCFRNFGKSIVEVIQFPKLTRRSINRIVSYEGKESLDAALRKGRGVVLVTGHLGNWEILGASLALNGYPLTVIARELRSKRLNALLCAHRQHVGMEILFRGKSMIRGLRFLKRNGILAILADVDTQTPGVFVDFFDRPAYTPYGPIAIALRTQAVLLPMFVIRLPDNSHRVFIHEPMHLLSTGDWDSDLQVNTQRFTSLIESYIRKYPGQWIWMHRRWKTQCREKT